MLMENIITQLKAPFPVEKLSWRVGNKSNWDNQNKRPKDPSKPVKANMLVYIDSRDVQDRLDEVCAGLWSCDFKEVNGRIVCNLTIGNITRSDGAGDTDFEAEKGGLSDAFKRAAVMFGVGRYLYNAKNFNTWVEYGKDDNDYTIVEKAKEVLKPVAQQLGISVQTYEYWLGRVDWADDIILLNFVAKNAHNAAKREAWNTGKLETMKEHIEKKRKELKKDKQDGQQDK